MNHTRLAFTSARKTALISLNTTYRNIFSEHVVYSGLVILRCTILD